MTQLFKNFLKIPKPYVRYTNSLAYAGNAHRIALISPINLDIILLQGQP